MKPYQSHLCLALSTLSMLMLMACAGPDRSRSKPVDNKLSFASPSGLTAALTNDDVVLNWKNNATAEGGSWVEFATPGSEFTKLVVFLSEAQETTFLHPNVAPQTHFIYHILPFFGYATQPMHITTGAAPAGDAPVLEEGPLSSTNTGSNQAVSQKSIRSQKTFAAAAPADLTATLSSPTSVDLHWKDNALNEDGYLVELGARPDGYFMVCALLPPDTTSFRKTGLPPETQCYFRVRAFFYGKPSKEASVTTKSELKSSPENAIK